MPENHDAMGLFMASDTQWRVVASLAGVEVIGLDYPACELVADSMGLDWAEVSPKISLPERETLKARRH